MFSRIKLESMCLFLVLLAAMTGIAHGDALEISDENAFKVLKKLNDARNALEAARMDNLIYSDDLATDANKYITGTATFDSSQTGNAAYGVAYKYNGNENSATAQDAMAVLILAEKTNYDDTTRKCSSLTGETCGYGQVIWEKAKKVGCAYKTTASGSNGNTILVCVFDVKAEADTEAYILGNPKFRNPILEWHNKIRKDLGQTTAGQLKWDYDLVAKAAELVDSNIDIVLAKKDANLGYNHETTETSVANYVFSPEHIFNKWVEQEKKMKTGDTSVCESDNGSNDCSKYVQLVWASTTKVGCYFAASGSTKKSALVCAYDQKAKLNEKAYGPKQETQNNSSVNDCNDSKKSNASPYQQASSGLVTALALVPVLLMQLY